MWTWEMWGPSFILTELLLKPTNLKFHIFSHFHYNWNEPCKSLWIKSPDKLLNVLLNVLQYFDNELQIELILCEDHA